MQNLTESELTLKKEFVVTSAHTDMFGRLRLSGLVDFLVQSAIYSADKLGFGLKFLREEKLFWVLNRLTVNIKRQLNWYDVAIVETWPKTVEGLLYIRDFIVRDKQNRIVATGTSAWIAIDLIRLRPKKITGIITEIFYSLKHKNAIEEIPEKLNYVENGEKNKIQTTFFDLDLNKHVTTTRYIDWMMDQFTIDFHKTNYPKKLSINFLKETKPKEKIEIFKNELVDNAYHFEGMNISSEIKSFRGEVCF
jgi:acyl-ACP thioesterase